jgi:hypothetical protein
VIAVYLLPVIVDHSLDRFPSTNLNVYLNWVNVETVSAFVIVLGHEDLLVI